MKNKMTLEVEGNEGEYIQLEITERDGTRRKRKVKTWTAEEDELLISLYEKYPKKWSFISSLMPQRNQNQCLHRFRRLSQLGRQRKIWSDQEDQTIKKLIKKVGKNWKFLSEMLGTKTGKQIRERYINKLDPKIKKEDWSEEQDLKLIQLYSQYGSRWSEIAKKLQGRPENRIKNRFYSYIKRNYEIKEVVVKEDASAKKPPVEKQPTKPLGQKNRQSIELIGLESQNYLHKAGFHKEEKSINSKIFLDGTELLIRQYKQPLISSKRINITSFTNFPEEDMVYYLENRPVRNESSLYLDNM